MFALTWGRVAAIASLTGASMLTVPAPGHAQPEPTEYAGYLFTYFTGEGTADGEQVYFALSNGNDPLSWRELNDGQPVVTSDLGTTGVRDPFIIRSPDGDRFYLIATDLKIHGNGDWDGAQRHGSKSIMVWESTDLVNWTDQRLARVAPDNAGNTWAPEAYYDESLGSYVVFWASKLYDDDDPDHTGNTYNRMMYATTQDFRTFSEPQVWNDPGYSVIDSTVTQVGDTYYRFTKDERSNEPGSPCGKFITAETSDSLTSTDWDFQADCIGSGTISQGEGPLVFASNTEDKWYLFIDEFGGRGYVPFESTDLSTGQWTASSQYSLPSSPRHGTVLPVTAEEYQRLLQAYAPDQLPTQACGLSTVRTGIGQPPVLPATVIARYADGVRRPATVDWDPVPRSAYDRPGRFRVSGTLTDNPGLRVRTTVVVRHSPVTDSNLILHYRFDETDGAVVRDSSGRGFHGTYQRAPAWDTGMDGGAFAMSGGAGTSATAPYVSIPPGLLDGVDDITVASWVNWSESTTINQWIYSLGPDNGRYLFTSPYNGGQTLYSAITTGSWQAESRMASSAALPGGWQHVAVTVDSADQTAVMYLNGDPVATAADVTVTPADLHNPPSAHSGYIGRSLYAADPYFAGAVDEFRVYDTALSASEIMALAGDTTGITGVTLPELKVDAIIDSESGNITLPVRDGTDVTRLAPEFALADGAVIEPPSGTVGDFTEPVEYTVTGTDGTTRGWSVRAVEMRSPVLPGLYADPNIAVFGDTFYLYPTTDGFAGWSGTQFHAFSSTDLVNWTDHGVILDLATDVTWADNSAWAPTIAEKDGKYYFYFSGGPADGDTRKHLGVAVSDSPTGPFTDALGEPLVPAGSYSGQMIDPAVFTDDDGQSYLYWGNGNSYQVPLGDDMVSFDPALVRTYHPANYNEGSFVIERDGVYYLMWSENDTRSEDYQVAYATGDSPLGPWSDRVGVILHKDLGLGIKGTGHHSVVHVPGTGDWYIAYHRFAIPDGDGTHRETTVDRLEFDDGGAIMPVTPTLESIDPVTVPA